MLTNNQLCGFSSSSTFVGQFFTDDFESYDLGSRVMFLNSNNGYFSGTGWAIRAPFQGMQGLETFEDYNIGLIEGTSMDAGGVGWETLIWALRIPFRGMVGIDWFETSPSGDEFAGGEGYEGRWESRTPYKIIGADTFETYELGSVSELANGNEWSAQWRIS